MNLLKDPVKSLIIRLAIPIMATGLLRASYELVDMIFASRLGGIQVASVAFVTPIFRLVMAFGQGITVAGVSLIAKRIGERRFSEAGVYADQLRLIIVVTSISIALIGIVTSDPLLRSLGLRGDLFHQSLIYTGIRFVSIPFILIFQVYLALNSAQGKTNTTLKMSLLGITCNTILNSFFILYLKSGIDGLAYATTLSQGIQAIAIIIIFHRRSHDFEMKRNIFRSKFSSNISKTLMKTGLPLAFSQSSTNFGFLLMNMFIVPYGYEVIAGFSIGNQINALFFAPATGIGQSLIPLIAQNYGNKAYKRINSIVKTGMLYTLIFTVICAITLQLIAKPFGAFLAKGDTEVLRHVINFLRLCSWTIIGWGIYQSLSGIFTGFQKTKITMTINLVRLWGLRIPILAIFRFLIPTAGEYGVWISHFLSNFGAALCAIIIYITKFRVQTHRSFFFSHYDA